MAGIDTEIEGEARPQPGIKIGYLPQEPQLNPEHTVRESVEEAVAEVVNALKGLMRTSISLPHSKASSKRLSGARRPQPERPAGARGRRPAPAGLGCENR